MLLTACGNRRETVCPACSAVYKRDARQLVRAGLMGGKDVPETIAEHPCVFATLTAPSFGPVHARRMRGKTVLPCRPRRDPHARRCPHGRDISCARRHNPDDPRLGRPLCGDCYDYTAAVAVQRRVPETCGAVFVDLPAPAPGPPRRADPSASSAMSSRSGTSRSPNTRRAASSISTPSSASTRPARLAATRPFFTAAMLSDAIRPAAAAVPSSPATAPATPVALRFGDPNRPPARPPQTRLPGTGRELSVQAVANYIAKYATKALDAPGIPDRRLRSRARPRQSAMLPPHTADDHHRLGTRRRQAQPRRTRGCASGRTCSATAATSSPNPAATPSPSASSAAPAPNTASQNATPNGERDPWDRPLDDTVVLVLSTWPFEGPAYTTAPGAELALTSAALARDHEQAAADDAPDRLVLSLERSDHL